MRALWTAIAVAGPLIGALPAAAQGSRPTNDGWQFSLTPYTWFAGVSGDVELPRGGTRDFGADFGDIFDSLKFGVMATFEARRDRFEIVLDFFYIDLDQGFNSPRSGAVSNGDVKTTTTEFSMLGLYRVIQDSRYSLDVGAGLRAWWLDTEIRANAGLLAGRSASASSNWVDPIFAARGHLRLTHSVSLTAYADIGGFDTGSQLTWQAIGAVDWQVTGSIAARIGWRHIYIDYSKNDVTVDMSLSGPFLGVTFRF